MHADWTPLHTKLLNGLVSLGLYTSLFELTMLALRETAIKHAWRTQARQYRVLASAGTMGNTVLSTHAKYLLTVGAIDQSHIEDLHKARLRRNTFSHEGYNGMFEISPRELWPCIQKMDQVVQHLEHWRIKNIHIFSPPQPADPKTGTEIALGRLAYTAFTSFVASHALEMVDMVLWDVPKD
jgi:hypothetical protein